MADKSTYVQVGKQKLTLTNLGKVLYPDDGISKAEIIAYLVEIAPHFLALSKGRPLSLIRYPDGIGEEHFFQKDIPSWAPEWVRSVRLGKEHKKNYIVAENAATLAWIGNMAGLEIHQMNVREPHLDSPDYIAFDLDPAPGTDFSVITETASALGNHLREYGYEPFFKTSGSRGIHIFTPVNPTYSIDQCFKASHFLADTFQRNHKHTTLELSKAKRKGRMLIDIYRNRNGQTIVSPFSLRARPGAPVSMPVSFDELPGLVSSTQYSLKAVLKILKEKENPWEGMFSHAVPLHSDRKSNKKQNPGNPSRLKEYGSKRIFSGSPEPLPEMKTGDGFSFVLHRHDASRLHYDLRFEEDGALSSWALPKGLPERPGIKHLAIRTEDHPLDYLNFQGDIPKGEYGGGRMWIFARGKYEIIKKKKNGFYFRLDSKQFNGEFRMHEMKPSEWLLERVDDPVNDWVKHPPGPMLADQKQKVPAGKDYTYELKWDGIRAICCYSAEGFRIISRNGRDISDQFPEFKNASFHAYDAVIDAEIVCFDKDGKPDFQKVVSRVNRKRPRAGHAYLYAFDLLYLDGRPIHNEPLWKRRNWLEETLKGCRDPFRLSKEEEDGKALFTEVKKAGLEGIMAKKLDGKYHPGKRTSDWIKVKVRSESTVYIIGYAKGNNERDKTFGALHIAEWVDDHFIYRGKVGTGFSEKQLINIKSKLSESKKKLLPEIENAPAGSSEDIWVKPENMIEVKYASLTNRGTYREPVFVRLK